MIMIILTLLSKLTFLVVHGYCPALADAILRISKISNRSRPLERQSMDRLASDVVLTHPRRVVPIASRILLGYEAIFHVSLHAVVQYALHVSLGLLFEVYLLPRHCSGACRALARVVEPRLEEWAAPVSGRWIVRCAMVFLQ